METQPHKSPLHNLHLQLEAKMIDFAGWTMPVLYRGIIEEHNYTRQVGSFFDVSHMGRLLIQGPQAEQFLQRMCTRSLTDMAPGVSHYSHICREDGGILDDVIVSRFEKHFLIVCNASNREKIVTWLLRQAEGQGVTLEDQTFQSAMIALQGPQAMAVAQKLLQVDLSGLKRYHHTSQMLMTYRCNIFRSGYTGEDGVEIIIPLNLVRLALPAILGGDGRERILKPAGLGSRDTLRLEAGMPLYGHELTEEWDSLTAGQAWAVDLKKDFIGAAAMRRLKDAGVARQLVGLHLEGKRTARQGYAVMCDGAACGVVTSGALSPTLGRSIAMGLVDSGKAVEGSRLSVDFSGKPVPATVVRLPFYKRTA